MKLELLYTKYAFVAWKLKKIYFLRSVVHCSLLHCFFFKAYRTIGNHVRTLSQEEMCCSAMTYRIDANEQQSARFEFSEKQKKTLCS